MINQKARSKAAAGLVPARGEDNFKDHKAKNRAKATAKP
jgi:hypothetical protein